MEVHLQNKTAFEKQKLCHSLGRPSRSDFVQLELYPEMENRKKSKTAVEVVNMILGV